MTGFEEVLAFADDAMVAAQRLAEWCTRAHEMEEDVALANLALDQLGTARLLLTYAGELEGAGRDEDALAYLRDDHEFRNVLLVELPNGDFAVTTAKLLFLAAYQLCRYRSLAEGDDGRLAAIAVKAAKESAYHLDHASLWTVRLGDGTAESHRRMQAAVDGTWPYTYELFEPAGGTISRVPPESAEPALPALLPRGRRRTAVPARRPESAKPASPVLPLFEGTETALGRAEWLAVVEPVLAEATLTRPADSGWALRGGREGRHTEHLSSLLAEMQELHRAHPGARW